MNPVAPPLLSRPLNPALSVHTLARTRWDLLVIGGGITGAGVFREAALAGLRVLLVEGEDFASGTSSRSSKLVHGGLHYLARLDLPLALEAMREREELIRRHPGLVHRLPFLLPIPPGASTAERVQYHALVLAYRLLGGGGPGASPMGSLPPPSPGLVPSSETGALLYMDGQTDDAGLVLRVLLEGSEAGGTARCRVRAEACLADPDGQVRAVLLQDRVTGSRARVEAGVVVNATGPWADLLGWCSTSESPSTPTSRRGSVQEGRVPLPRVRRIRGSHLVIPYARLPLPCAVVHLRPSDGSAVVMVPWMGVTLVGGTTVAHEGTPDSPVISEEEFHLLLDDVHRLFPARGVGPGDVQATFAGVRPLTDLDTRAPSQASRRDALHASHGVLTPVGGKLTTFQAMARRCLEGARPALPPFRFRDADPPRLENDPLLHPAPSRWVGRHGEVGGQWIARARTPRGRLLRQLAWVARNEGVVHLDDLLLRRTRLGLLLPRGGRELLSALGEDIGRALGWPEARWKAERERYRELLDRAFPIPVRRTEQRNRLESDP